MNSEVLREIACSYKESIPHPFNKIIESGGFDAIYALCQYYGGSSTYIPRPDKLFKRCIERAIVNEFDGYNYKALMRKYGFTEKTLRRLIHNANSEE